MKSRLVRMLVIVVMMVCWMAYGSPMNSLFSDHRAMRVDDILTVHIVESAKAGSQSKTNTSKENKFGVEAGGGSGALGFLPSFGASGGNNAAYDGKGGTSREGQLVATVTARVVKVMGNGNLIIDGSKVVEINDEKEIIKVSGTVRPEDVQKSNIIYSSSIADAQITYSGKGAAHDGQRPGLIARFLNWIF